MRLSDYWSMTGHCAYPENGKWKQICSNCPDLKRILQQVQTILKSYGKKEKDNQKLIFKLQFQQETFS